jgi:HEAT repeat protein
MNGTSLYQHENQISTLIHDLGSSDGPTRQRARLMLVHLGREGVPALLEALGSHSVYIRWEAAKALGEQRDPQIAPALTALLCDQDAGVRWAAADSLIWQGRAALGPLLEYFIHNFDSPWVREATRHILHVFRDRHLLDDEELALLNELNRPSLWGIETIWASDAPWAAERALETLDREKLHAIGYANITTRTSTRP